MGRSSTTKSGPLPAPEVRLDDESLTRFAGMLPFIRFCAETLKLPHALAGATDRSGRRPKHPLHHVLFAFLIGAVLGVGRLRHLELLSDDPLRLKLVRLGSWPVRKVFSAAMEGVSDAGVASLISTLGDLGLRSVPGTTHAVLDFDSTALICFGEQENAVFGYNGKGRNRRRHFPLVASIAESRAVVNAKYRVLVGRGVCLVPCAEPPLRVLPSALRGGEGRADEGGVRPGGPPTTRTPRPR